MQEKVQQKKIQLWQTGRLSIRDEEQVSIIANEIKDFSENQTQKILTLDITNLEESQKAKLRGAIRFFHGDRNNMNVQIKVNDEFKPCGQIYLTPEILQFFKSIVGEENCKI